MTDALCTSEEDTVWRIQWPDATPGSTQSVHCPGEGDVPGLGLAHRNCLTGGVWGSVDASNCEPVAIRYIGIQVGACSHGAKHVYCMYGAQHGIHVVLYIITR